MSPFQKSLFRFTIFLVLAGNSIQVVAQTDGPELTVGQLIQQAYEISKTAEKSEQFTATVKICDQALARKPSDAQKKYLNQLKSWSLLSRAR